MSLRFTHVAAVGIALFGTESSRAELGHGAFAERVGPSNAPYAMPGVDGARSRRSNVTLSSTPKVGRRLRIAYAIGRGLVTLGDGGFFVLHPSARASRFDAQGKLLFSLKLAAEPSSPPVVTSSGRVAFVSAGSLLMVDERGNVRSQTPLGDADFTARSILATRDGGIAVASNSRLVRLSASGEPVFVRGIPETPLDLLETAAALWCVSAPGSVFRLDAAGRLNKVGELGGTASAVSLDSASQRLVARLGAHRLLAFDLRLQRTVMSVEDATLELDGPVLFDAEQSAHAFSSDGILVRYRADGSESQRVPIDPGARKAPGGEDALLLADGRLLVARAGADVVVVTPAGEVSSIPGSACPDPLGLAPVGPSSVVLSCRSGNVQWLE